MIRIGEFMLVSSNLIEKTIHSWSAYSCICCFIEFMDNGNHENNVGSL